MSVTKVTLADIDRWLPGFNHDNKGVTCIICGAAVNDASTHIRWHKRHKDIP